MEDIYTLSDVQIQKKIGDKIKAARLKQNITQDSLAESASRWPEIAKNCGVPQKMIDARLPYMLLNL